MAQTLFNILEPPPGLLTPLAFTEPFSSLQFEQPGWLLVIPFLLFISWWIARPMLRGWERRRHAIYLTIRSVLLAALCFALADPSLHRPSRDVAVVVVRDTSRSIPPEQQRSIDGFLAASLGRKPSADRIGVVTAAKSALVQSIPSAVPELPDLVYTGDPNETNLEQAIQLAWALLPSDAAGRILLMSDGNQTAGSVDAAIRGAVAAGVPIDVVPVEYDRSGSIQLSDVVVPAWTRADETISAKVVIHAGRETSGELTLLLNEQSIDLDPDRHGTSKRITLTKGVNVFTVPIRLSDSPIHEVRAFLRPEDQSQLSVTDLPELLSAAAVSFSSTRARILLLTENPEAHEPFVRAVSSEDLVVEAMSAAEALFTLTELSAYDAIILANQPASNFTQSQQQDLVRFVHDTGGGLIVLGGPDSFGAGGWIGSPLAEALPLQLDPPQRRQMPMGALALIIDRSGSMSAPVLGTGLSQQQIANEAAILGMRSLSRLDQIAVIAFSGSNDIIVPLSHCSDPDTIAKRIRSIGSGGGTNLFPAIEAAHAELARSPASVRHVIILTDGETMGDPMEGMAHAIALQRDGITLSTISIGDFANDQLLVHLAQLGGGNWYNVRSKDSFAVLPKIFIKEAQTIRRSLIWEGDPFQPVLGDLSDSLRGMPPSLPPISGYVVTTDRGGLSTIPLRGPENDPILAQWQHGLGRVTAFTSDATSRWNSGWINWPNLAPFWKQQLRWTMRPTGDPNARITIEQDADRARIIVELFDDAGERLNFAQLAGTIIPPSSGSPGRASPARSITLRQVGPGRYESVADIAEPGVHLISLRYERAAPSGTTGADQSLARTLRTAIIRRSGDEVRRTSPDLPLLTRIARETGGRVIPLTPAGADLWSRERTTMPLSARFFWLLIVLASIGIFLTDVAARRVEIKPAMILRWLRTRFAPAPVSQRQLLGNLAAAKARAGTSSHDHSALPVHLDSRPIATDGPAPSPLSPVQSSAKHAPAAPHDADQPSDTDQPPDTFSRLRAAKARSQQQSPDDP